MYYTKNTTLCPLPFYGLLSGKMEKVGRPLNKAHDSHTDSEFFSFSESFFLASLEQLDCRLGWTELDKARQSKKRCI